MANKKVLVKNKFEYTKPFQKKVNEAILLNKSLIKE